MRPSLASLIALAALTGCVTVKHQLTEPNVAARFDSTKTAEAFAQCAAAALPGFKVEKAGGAWSLIRKADIRLLARWDIFPTNHGSQAELRNGAGDDGGAPAVRGCA